MNPLPPFPNCSKCNYAIMRTMDRWETEKLYVCKVDGCFLFDLQFDYLCNHGCLKHPDALKYLTDNAEVIAKMPEEIAIKEGMK